jgi:predicted flavoprotein YhiN
MTSEVLDVLIVGAGAAGMMCAAEAGKRGRSVLVVDHARDPGEKIRISGGGRCNFTNLGCGPHAFLGENPRFAASALSRYTQHDFIALVNRYGIGWHEKTLGQLFCDDSAKAIVALLVRELKGAGATLSTAGGWPSPRWCWPQAASRSRRWGPRAGPMTRRAASACASRTPARRWCP